MNVLPNRLEWLVAWRHLRMGDEVPAWARWLTILSIYLLAAGGALAWYAYSLDPGGAEVVVTVSDPMEQGDAGA